MRLTETHFFRFSPLDRPDRGGFYASVKIASRVLTVFLLFATAVVRGEATSTDARGPGGKEATADVIKADTLAWLRANNEDLPPDFLRSEPPGRLIRLPDGREVELYRLNQFLEVNFRLTLFARKQEKGSGIVPVMQERMRKLMARPEFRERVLSHRPEYKIAGKGKVSAAEAYQHFRNIKRNLGVAVDSRIKAPVGGGSGINAPSWAVWKQMNLVFHEACHCIGIGHDSGGLSGPIAGSMRQWDRKKLWNYETIDVNTLPIPAL